MFHVEDRTLRTSLIEKQKQARSLNASEGYALAAELANPEYAGMTTEQKLDALNEWTPGSREVTIEKTDVDAMDVMNALFNYSHASGVCSWRVLNDMAAADQSIWEAVEAIKSYGAAGKPLNLSNPKNAAMVPAFLSFGLLGQHEIDKLTKETKTEYFDVPPKAFGILGDGAFVERTDIEGL